MHNVHDANEGPCTAARQKLRYYALVRGYLVLGGGERQHEPLQRCEWSSFERLI
jgi:hypothetical protein